MFVLKDITTARYISTRRSSATMPRLVDLAEADRFKTRMDAGLALLRLPLTVLAVAEEVPNV